MRYAGTRSPRSVSLCLDGRDLVRAQPVIEIRADGLRQTPRPRHRSAPPLRQNGHRAERVGADAGLPAEQPDRCAARPPIVGRTRLLRRPCAASAVDLTWRGRLARRGRGDENGQRDHLKLVMHRTCAAPGNRVSSAGDYTVRQWPLHMYWRAAVGSRPLEPIVRPELQGGCYEDCGRYVMCALFRVDVRPGLQAVEVEEHRRRRRPRPSHRVFPASLLRARKSRS